MKIKTRLNSDFVGTIADLEDYGNQPMSVRELMDEFDGWRMRPDLEGLVAI